MKNVILEVDGSRWLVVQGDSIKQAISAIAWARCRGSVGATLVDDRSACGGKVETTEVKRIDREESKQAA